MRVYRINKKKIRESVADRQKALKRPTETRIRESVPDCQRSKEGPWSEYRAVNKT